MAKAKQTIKAKVQKGTKLNLGQMEASGKSKTQTTIKAKVHKRQSK